MNTLAVPLADARELRTPLSEWSSLLMSALADAGVQDLVASPGARSTPFVLAASREERLTVHDVIDERAAAFFALGRTRATGRPTALLCTSGSAPAHWYPAVLEASRAHLPLVLLTADRPYELQACGAAQTVDQEKLFGGHVRLFLDSGLPDVAGLRGLRRMAAQLVCASQHPTPGPVHLNLRARKPLEPFAAADEREASFARRAQAEALRGAPLAVAAAGVPSSDALRPMAEALAKSPRGLIVAGAPGGSGISPALAARLSRVTGYPLLCDATSGLRTAAIPGALGSSDLLLASEPLRRSGVGAILQLGPAPVSSAWEGLCSAASVKTHVVLSAHGWEDPANTATHLALGDLDATADALSRLLAETMRPEASWSGRFAALDVAVQQGLLAAVRSEHLSEAGVARALVRGLPEGAALVVGNSLPIRLVEAFGGLAAAGVEVFAQRGLNGIDGLVAGAAGIASTGRPTVLLVGDVSAVHDLGSLAIARSLGWPLVVVVLNNGGGRIFEQLPVAKAGLTDGELRHFTTPHETDFEAAAKAFGARFARPQSPAAFVEAVTVALTRAGATLVEVVVPPQEAVRLRAALQARVDGLVRAEFEVVA